MADFLHPSKAIEKGLNKKVLDDSLSTWSMVSRIITIKDFTGRENRFFASFSAFFRKNPSLFQIMVDIVEGRSKISLRILDYFVIKYARTHKVSYPLKEGAEKIEEFNVFLEYRSYLTAYKKRYFDPFRRKSKFYFSLGKTQLLTSLGQLNFFQWALANKVIVYVEKYYANIVEDMNLTNRTKKALKEATKEVQLSGSHKTVVSVKEKERKTLGDKKKEKITLLITFD